MNECLCCTGVNICECCGDYESLCDFHKSVICDECIPKDEQRIIETTTQRQERLKKLEAGYEKWKDLKLCL